MIIDRLITEAWFVTSYNNQHSADC